jgi:hypothetical protein
MSEEETKICAKPGCGNRVERKSWQKPHVYKRTKYCSRQCCLVVARAEWLALRASARAATFGAEPADKRDYLAFATQQAERFWSWVTKAGADDCWPWTGQVDKDGYGKFNVTLPMVDGVTDQATVRSHRLALELTSGELLGERLSTHSCDNPPCCNPKHLSPGTPLSNMREKIERGRARYGKKRAA